jgi:hypothetical protein
VLRDRNHPEVMQSSLWEEAVGVFRDRPCKAHAVSETCLEVVVDKFDGDAEQILGFGRVELNVTYGMDGGTLNRVTDGIPEIFDVGSSKRDIE